MPISAANSSWQMPPAATLKLRNDLLSSDFLSPASALGTAHYLATKAATTKKNTTKMLILNWINIVGSNPSSALLRSGGGNTDSCFILA
jgi:hypothetical protein